MMASLNYGYVHGRYTEAPVADPGVSQSRILPNAPTHYAAAKFIVPIIPSTLSGAVRAAFEDRRRIDTTLNAKSDRAVVADIVLSGVIAKHGLRYAGGVYNLFNWQYALPAAPYAANVMPQNGRTFMLSLTLAR
jgi:outer membrane receptor protein involved in Fe transport